MGSQTLCWWNCLYEEVRAVNMQDAKTTALARNPTARLIGVNPIVGG